MTKEITKLGDLVQDKVSGFKGIATQRVAYLYGCTRIGIQATLNKEGEIPDIHWFDEPSIKIIKTKVIEVEAEDMEQFGTGGAIQAVKPIQNPK